MKAKSNILIISDMGGYGKVSAAVQMPILSYMGHDVFNLPTMLISNTFPYGKYAVMESTSYMKDAMQKWDELGIHFVTITTGVSGCISFICCNVSRPVMPGIISSSKMRS